MIIFFFLVFVVHSCLPLLCSATYDNNSMPKCPKSFYCPSFGWFHSPFYEANASVTHCGLIKVKCTWNQSIIQFGDEAPSYEIDRRKLGHGPDTMVVRNTAFQELIEHKMCEALENNFTSPTPPPFSISLIEPAMMTLFKCTRDPSFAQQKQIDAYFIPQVYNSYNSCKDRYFYYKHLFRSSSVPSDLPLPHTCQVIRLPMKKLLWADHYEYSGNVFSLLAHEFAISFNLSTPCEECRRKEENHDDRKLTLILVSVGSALIILILSCAIFIIWRYRKTRPFSYVSSKDKSPDVEDGSYHLFGVSVFSYDELKDATQNFDPCRQLGDGGFGAVYYGKLQDGREVAVKRLYRHNYKRVQQFINEVEILAKLRHPNLVLLYGCTSKQSQELLLVYEYIRNGTVGDHLHGPQANPSLLTWPIRMNIAIETASALAYLHATEIIHRDVKTNNILLDHNFCVKVADFGLSRLLPNYVSHVSTTPQGTPGYVDPQYHQRYQLTDKSDVYSFGVVLVELISSMVAIDLSRSSDEISLANLAINRIQRRVVNQLIDPVLGSDSDSETMRMITSVAELAFRCLQFDSEMRPTMAEVLEVLEDIRGAGRTNDYDGIIESKNLQPPTLSETTNDMVDLLKEQSPVSVTGGWQSGSSGLTTPSSSGDRLPIKNHISK